LLVTAAVLSIKKGKVGIVFIYQVRVESYIC
jgi:hypothetical protein